MIDYTHFYNNVDLLKKTYVSEKLTINIEDIKDGSSILMLGMGSLYFTTLKPNCKFDVVENNIDIINQYKHKLTENIKIFEGNAFNKIEGLKEFYDYIFIDIFTTVDKNNELDILKDQYSNMSNNIFHFKSIQLK